LGDSRCALPAALRTIPGRKSPAVSEMRSRQCDSVVSTAYRAEERAMAASKCAVTGCLDPDRASRLHDRRSPD
jgi:hypothetical protein